MRRCAVVLAGVALGYLLGLVIAQVVGSQWSAWPGIALLALAVWLHDPRSVRMREWFYRTVHRA